MLRRPLLSTALATTTLALLGCRATRPSDLPIPDTQDCIVAVKSCPLGTSRWWQQWAHHAWVDVKRSGSPTWERLESGGHFGIVHMDVTTEEARLDHRFGERTVRLLGWVDGDEARAAIAGIDRASSELARRYGDDYTLWPGPNSNTFVRELLADVPSLGFVFDPNCVGKDYSPWLGASATASKTGLRVDTPILGAAVGLREGVELHVLQLTLGVSLDPPGISLPFLPQIPWGWFGAPPARLTPPPLANARTITLDPATTDGERREIGRFTGEFTLLFARPDERAWLLVGGKPDGPAHFELAFERHEQDGVFTHGAHGDLDPAAPVEQRLQCDEAVILLELAAHPTGGVRLAARCFADQQHEFDVMSRLPR